MPPVAGPRVDVQWSFVQWTVVQRHVYNGHLYNWRLKKGHLYNWTVVQPERWKTHTCANICATDWQTFEKWITEEPDSWKMDTCKTRHKWPFHRCPGVHMSVFQQPKLYRCPVVQLSGFTCVHCTNLSVIQMSGCACVRCTTGRCNLYNWLLFNRLHGNCVRCIACIGVRSPRGHWHCDKLIAGPRSNIQ